MPGLRVFRLGTLPYEEAYRWQQQTCREVRDGATDAIALLQHPPTITLGRRGRDEHVLWPQDEIERRGGCVVHSDRGGDVTYHGPGQLVAYPMVNLRRRGLGAVDYVRALEETMIVALQAFGIEAERVLGRPGVWVHGAKIGAVGVRVREGVSLHGFALNISPEMSWFEAIVPCGIRDAGVTSMAEMGTSGADLTVVGDAVLEAFRDVLARPLTAALHPPMQRRGAR